MQLWPVFHEKTLPRPPDQTLLTTTGSALPSGWPHSWVAWAAGSISILRGTTDFSLVCLIQVGPWGYRTLCLGLHQGGVERRERKETSVKSFSDHLGRSLTRRLFAWSDAEGHGAQDLSLALGVLGEVMEFQVLCDSINLTGLRCPPRTKPSDGLVQKPRWVRAVRRQVCGRQAWLPGPQCDHVHPPATLPSALSA